MWRSYYDKCFMIFDRLNDKQTDPVKYQRCFGRVVKLAKHCVANYTGLTAAIKDHATGLACEEDERSRRLAKMYQRWRRQLEREIKQIFSQGDVGYFVAWYGGGIK